MVFGDEIIGFLDAWHGVMHDQTMPLNVRGLRGMLPRGGTLLGTKRGGPYDDADGVELVKRAFDTHQLDAMIVIGGNGSLSVASRLMLTN